MRRAPTLAATSPPAECRPAPLHLGPLEREALGRSARAAVSRSAHAELGSAGADRDPVGLLEQQAGSRVADLVPIRYGRMLSSPFAFFRGAALIMAHDLAQTPRTGLTVQLCGDAHLSNFGLFASPERRLVFDLNDFDETFPGPFEWDVKRLAASLAIAGRENGFPRPERQRIVLASMARYRTAMRDFAGRGHLEVWYAGVDTAGVEPLLTARLGKAQRTRLARTVAKAQTKDSAQAQERLTAVTDGARRIVADPPLVVPIADLLPDVERVELTRLMEDILEGYATTLSSDRRRLLASFRLVDVARKVVGVGSVGTRAWILLLEGRDGSDPLFLQAKEAQPSVLEGLAGPAELDDQGERVVAGQRLMQAAGDIFLGWQRVRGLDGRQRDFYVRQLRDWKASAVVEEMVPDGMRAYGELCGWTLARAHARSGDRIAVASYLGNGASFDRAVARFAESYADRNEEDHRSLEEAVRTGRVVARVGL
jgi:uncharacterized protein (DUF2252 family)